MDILIHLGLNKCASTYIQQALAAAQAVLRQQGVFYAVEGGRPAQYGLSRHYGFGPDVDGVTPRSLGWLTAEASRRHCTRLIISSEYLSLCRPAAIAAFVADLQPVTPGQMEPHLRMRCQYRTDYRPQKRQIGSVHGTAQIHDIDPTGAIDDPSKVLLPCDRLGPVRSASSTTLQTVTAGSPICWPVCTPPPGPMSPSWTTTTSIFLPSARCGALCFSVPGH